MRIARLLPALLIAASFAGCTLLSEKKEIDLRAKGRAEVDGLDVQLVMPRHEYAQGDEAPVTLTAVNTSGAPIVIDAESGAPVFVRIWRHTGLGWDEVKRYPQATSMVMKSWTLAPGAERTFRLLLPVEPDWPTGEPLKITGELNGRPQARPEVIVSIIPPEPGAE